MNTKLKTKWMIKTTKTTWNLESTILQMIVIIKRTALKENNNKKKKKKKHILKLTVGHKVNIIKML